MSARRYSAPVPAQAATAEALSEPAAETVPLAEEGEAAASFTSPVKASTITTTPAAPFTIIYSPQGLKESRPLPDQGRERREREEERGAGSPEERRAEATEEVGIVKAGGGES